jgi:hypothetical protein
MSKKRIKSCCLVIDASIGHAAGTLASPSPDARRCSDFLIAVRSVCHRMAWSEPIKAEWDRHQSRFTVQWLVTMMNLNKLRPVKDELHAELRNAIAEHSTDQNVIAIMLKDAHLVEAALSTDLRLASLDEASRGHFGRLSVTFNPLEKVFWVNPAFQDEETITWLENGARADRRRRLKSR